MPMPAILPVRSRSLGRRDVRHAPLAAFTTARMPALIGSGSVGHAFTTACRSGGKGLPSEPPPTAPDSAPGGLVICGFSGGFEDCSSRIRPSHTPLLILNTGPAGALPAQKSGPRVEFYPFWIFRISSDLQARHARVELDAPADIRHQDDLAAKFETHLNHRSTKYQSPIDHRSNCASNAIFDGVKSSFFTNAAASVAPCSRSIRLSSHSTDNGPA